jgi:hypothetical protein
MFDPFQVNFYTGQTIGVWILSSSCGCAVFQHDCWRDCLFHTYVLAPLKNSGYSCGDLLLWLYSITGSQVFFIPSSLFFWIRIIFAIWDVLCIHMSFMIEFSIFIKNNIGIFMGIALDLWIAFSSIAIFTLLFLTICELQRSFYLLVCSSISFFKDL